MTLDDLVVCDLDGNVLEGERGPTTEKALHLSCLRKHDDINATMHCHAKFATMFAVTRQPIPAVIEEFDVYVGGDVPVANYKATGSDDLGDEVATGSATAPRCSWPTTACSPSARTRRTRSRSRCSSSAPPRSCGAPARSASSCRSPSRQFAGYYRADRTGKF